jgi:hypothetical protein
MCSCGAPGRGRTGRRPARSAPAPRLRGALIQYRGIRQLPTGRVAATVAAGLAAWVPWRWRWQADPYRRRVSAEERKRRGSLFGAGAPALVTVRGRVDRVVCRAGWAIGVPVRMPLPGLGRRGWPGCRRSRW